MKFKFKLNSKLIIALMSLFASLIFVILGSKNKYCLSFGFIFLGCSLELFLFYLNEKYQKELTELAEEIDSVDICEDVDEMEKAYILQQHYIRQKRLTKKKRRTNIVFSICGVAIVLLGILNLF